MLIRKHRLRKEAKDLGAPTPYTTSHPSRAWTHERSNDGKRERIPPELSYAKKLITTNYEHLNEGFRTLSASLAPT